MPKVAISSKMSYFITSEFVYVLTAVSLTFTSVEKSLYSVVC